MGTLFSQRDPRWINKPLGFSANGNGGTIGQYGCLLTSFAMVASHFGVDTDPDRLNELLKQNNRFVNYDLLGDDALHEIFAGLRYVTKWDFTNTSADLSVLTNNFNDEYVIEVDFDHNPGNGIQTHFVRFVSWDGTNLVIDDPWYGTEDNFKTHYGSDLGRTILKIVKYQEVNNQPPPAEEDPPMDDRDVKTVYKRGLLRLDGSWGPEWVGQPRSKAFDIMYSPEGDTYDAQIQALVDKADQADDLTIQVKSQQEQIVKLNAQLVIANNKPSVTPPGLTKPQQSLVKKAVAALSKLIVGVKKT